FVHLSCLQAALRALHLSLEIVGAFHDMVSYVLTFAQLGNSPNCFCALNPEPLTPDWGGTDRIGSELQEIQKMIDSLHNPLDPSEVAQLLAAHREVIFLQFDAAIRHRLRERFLSSGNVSAYQSVTDRIYHALPPLSNSAIQSAFASQLRLPQLLDPQSCRTLMHFPWRTFLMDGGLFPVTINNTININYNMQLCLCSLSDADRRVAHGELVAMQFLMEDVLQGTYGSAVEDHADCQASLAKSKQQNLAEMVDSSVKWLQNSKKTCQLLLRHHDPVISRNLLRSFLILWKQLEILKAEWGRLKLRTEDINTVPLYKEFCKQYGADILYPAMKAIVRQAGTEAEFGEPIMSTQHVLPPGGASEIEMKVHQLQKLLESLEIHMIHDVQKKINQEMTLVTSERARQESSLPAELWKHRVMQENFSVVRPQIVETFVQRLMENYQESDTEVTFKKSHLQHCLTVLGCDIMARERSNFETYSMFYENILRQQHHLLYQKEQELRAVEGGANQSDMALTQIVGLCHGMIMEITALRSQLADLEEKNLGLKEKIRKEVRDEYESLVHNLFVTCVHLKGKLNVYRLSIEQRVFEIISEVRREGVDNMIDLKKKFGSTKSNGDLKEHLFKEQLQLLQDENIRLSKLVCKLKALNCWKQITQKAQLSAKLRDAEKEALQNKKECLNAKMMAEQEVTSFQGQLTSVRKALAKSQADNDKLKKQLHKQKQMLLEVAQRKTQEAKKKQILSVMKAKNIEKMLEEMKEKEQRVKCLTKEAEKSSKICHLLQKGVKKEMQQVRSQLTQECRLKWEALQQADELQCQVYDLEAAVSQRNAIAGSAAQGQRNKLLAPTQHGDYQQHPLNFDPRSSNGTGGNTQRPKTVPSRWKERTADRLLPHFNEKS
ncbi:CC162 protein, partial [Dromas ardeola]|nr:CC162 protein [Dromas ardeola]